MSPLRILGPSNKMELKKKKMGKMKLYRKNCHNNIVLYAFSCINVLVFRRKIPTNYIPSYIYIHWYLSLRDFVKPSFLISVSRSS